MSGIIGKNANRSSGVIGTSVAAAHTGNVAFPATQVASADANTLDDYEEGTYTPSWFTQYNNDHTYTNQEGGYTKIGNVVFCFFNIIINSAGTSSGWAYLTGFPFTAAGTLGHYGALNVGLAGALALPTAGYSMCGRFDLGSTSIATALWDRTLGTSTLQFSELSAGGTIQGTVMYKV